VDGEVAHRRDGDGHPFGGQRPKFDGLGQDERRSRELVGLDALVAQLIVAHRFVALERGQVGGGISSVLLRMAGGAEMREPTKTRLRPG